MRNRSECRVFVGNLPFHVVEHDLKKVFSSYGISSLYCVLYENEGTVTHVHVPRKLDNKEQVRTLIIKIGILLSKQQNRGFAFIHFELAKEAQAAQTFSGTLFHGRKVRVELVDATCDGRKYTGRYSTDGDDTETMTDLRTYEWGGTSIEKPDTAVDAPTVKETPNFEPSGILYKEQRKTRNGKELKFVEPLDSRKPESRWRLYVFKKGTLVPGEQGVYYIYRKSCYLFGRDRNVVDIPLDHPSCSKQHAVLQFRGVMSKDDKQYQWNFLNNKQIESCRYYELLERDMLRFGHSSLEFIVLNDTSASSLSPSVLEDNGS
eukprot:jgi/Galph1/594/GphlegSOOS_G5415.1